MVWEHTDRPPAELGRESTGGVVYYKPNDQVHAYPVSSCSFPVSAIRNHEAR